MKTTKNLYETRVVATKKIANSNTGSLWALLAKLASKPVTLNALVASVAKSDVFRKKRSPERRAVVARCRVRQAYTRFGYLRKA